MASQFAGFLVLLATVLVLLCAAGLAILFYRSTRTTVIPIGSTAGGQTSSEFTTFRDFHVGYSSVSIPPNATPGQFHWQPQQQLQAVRQRHSPMAIATRPDEPDHIRRTLRLLQDQKDLEDETEERTLNPGCSIRFFTDWNLFNAENAIEADTSGDVKEVFKLLPSNEKAIFNTKRPEVHADGPSPAMTTLRRSRGD